MFNENDSIAGYVADKAKHPADPPKKSQAVVPRSIAIAASLVVIFAGLKYASGLLAPVLLALFLTIILLIPLRWLQEHRVPGVLSYIIVLGSTIILFGVLSYFVINSLNGFIGKIPSMKDTIIQKVKNLKIEKQFEKFGFSIGEKEGEKKTAPTELASSTTNQDAPTESASSATNQDAPTELASSTTNQGAPTELASSTTNQGAPTESASSTTNQDAPADETIESKTIFDTLPTLPPEEVEQRVQQWNAQKTNDPSVLIPLDTQSVANWVMSTFLQLRHIAESGFLVLIFTIFMLFEASQFPAKVERAFGQNGAINKEHLHKIAKDIRRYLLLKTICNVMSATAAMFVYYLFGVPGYFLWGILAFFLYYIPNIGGTLAAVMPGILIFMNYDLSGVLLYAACLVCIECMIAYGAEPRILGHQLGLSTVVIILTLVFWGYILGPIGLFLAAPLTVMLKIILQAFPETEWVAVMLDDVRSQKKTN